MSDNIVIVGGGFAGITLAKRLERYLPKNREIYLLSRENFITYNPLLPEVVGASILPGHAVAPLRQMVKRTQIRMVTVTDIDLHAKRVKYYSEDDGSLEYDQLVIACGVDANQAIVPGMADHGLPLKTVGDALYLRNRVIERLEQASMQRSPERLRSLLTFVVVGGGFSGVEVAGELFDFLSSAVKYYGNVTREDCRVIILEGDDRLLKELSPSLGETTLQAMTKRGIEVCLNARVRSVEEGSVRMSSGDVVEGTTVICTLGTVPQSFTEKLRLPKQRNRIQTNPDMSVPGFAGVWALGDCALVPNAWDNSLSPPTAQYADRQARQLARNISARLRGEPTRPFSYRQIGQLASIGHNKAVAELFGRRLSGFIAWLLWRGVYLLKMPTLARKVRVFLEWNWAMFFPPDIAHLGFVRTGERQQAVEKHSGTRKSAGTPEELESALGDAPATANDIVASDHEEIR